MEREIPQAESQEWVWLSSLFTRLGTRSALLIATLAAAVQLVLARSGVQLDSTANSGRAGFLRESGWEESLLALALFWPCTALVSWVASRCFTREGSLIQFIGIVGVARVPLVLMGVFVLLLQDSIYRSWFDDGAGPGTIILSLITAAPLRFLTPVLVAAGVAATTRLAGGQLMTVLISAFLLPYLVARYLLGLG